MPETNRKPAILLSHIVVLSSKKSICNNKETEMTKILMREDATDHLPTVGID
jgi:hypothetical protein